jgi:hypothetical protein
MYELDARNVAAAEATGPHLFFRPPGRAGRIRHPELTVNVRDVDALIEALTWMRADGRR